MSAVLRRAGPDIVKRLEEISDLLYWRLDVALRKRSEMDVLERRGQETSPSWFLAFQERRDALDSAREYADQLRRASFPFEREPLLDQMMRACAI